MPIDDEILRLGLSDHSLLNPALRSEITNMLEMKGHMVGERNSQGILPGTSCNLL